MNEIILFKNNFCISTERAKLDLAAIHHFLSTQAYWSLNIPFHKVKNAVDNSLNFGVYRNDQQIGYGRIISDFSTIAYLGDVYIVKEFRVQGLFKWLMETIMQHPDLQGLRRWILLTDDAHGLYKQFGFTAIASPDKWMELHNKDAYRMAE